MNFSRLNFYSLSTFCFVLMSIIVMAAGATYQLSLAHDWLPALFFAVLTYVVWIEFKQFAGIAATSHMKLTAIAAAEKAATELLVKPKRKRRLAKGKLPTEALVIEIPTKRKIRKIA